jgi:hypothetical protein
MEWRCHNCKEQFVLGKEGGGVHNFRGKGVCQICYRSLEKFSNFNVEDFKNLFVALGADCFWKD